ncbi:MAG: hypothetical protein EPN61_05205 [Burkholderiaceae bacterium]|nr:MAG: hypothetical protein EPN61_05205 [Burkholderiaceae bacterium]
MRDKSENAFQHSVAQVESSFRRILLSLAMATYTFTQQEPVQKNNKLLGLEVVRFISALSVLVWHYQHFFYIADKPTDFVRELQPFYSMLSIFYDYGFYGVQVFWCISGFIFF